AGRSYLRRDIGFDLAGERAVGSSRVVLPEDRAPGDEQVGARVAHRPDVVRVDAAVDLDVDAVGKQATQLLDPRERLRHELLARETWMDAHAEREVGALRGPRGRPDLRLRVERDADAEAELA